MTFCFFSAQYLPTVGGVERYTYNLARMAAAAGHRALVVTSALPGLPDREKGPEGVEVLRLPVFPLMGGRFPAPRPGRKFAALSRWLWAQRPDFCLVNARFYPQSLWAARQCRKRGIPAILVDHSTGHLPMRGPVLSAAGAAYEHLAAAFLKRCRIPFYGVSEAVCRWLGHFGIRAAGVLSNAVDPEAVAAEAHAPDAADWRGQLGLGPDTLLAVFLGRLIPEKGVRQLIAAFQKAAVPGAALVVAGDGPLLAELRAGAPPGVFLPGAVDHARAMQLLAQAQAYCLPTFYAEGFPTTFLEAAACGCPILTTRTGGSGELLADESFGLELDSADAELWAGALRRALTDGDWRRAAARKTAARLAGRFTWQAVWEKLEAIAAQSQTNRKVNR